MASVTASTTSSRSRRAADWFEGWTLTYRILAVNLLTVLVLALGILYLDAFRNQLTDERIGQMQREAEAAAVAVASVPAAGRPRLVAAVSAATGSRIRLYGRDGRLALDSWTTTGPTYELRDPATQRWTKDAARAQLYRYLRKVDPRARIGSTWTI